MKLTDFLPARIYFLIGAVITTILFRFIPGWGDFYTTNIYPIIGSILSHISGIIPFAIGDIFIALSIAWILVYPPYTIFYKKKRIIDAIMRVAEYLLWLYVWFYFAWGINYSQRNIYDRIGMAPAEVSDSLLMDFAYRYADSLNASYANYVGTNKGIRFSYIDNTQKEQAEKAILREYNHIGRKEGINLPFNQSPHAKTMIFSRLSSMAGVTGSMGPFFCEFTLNGDIRTHEYPAIYAHEFSHLLGIANEGEANFYSYIVCTSSTDKFVRFSGYYHIFGHVVYNVYNIFGKKAVDSYLNRIRPEIVKLETNDLLYWKNKRCSAIDDFQDFIFDLYLKGNKVKEGRKSYSEVIGLILAWEHQKCLP